MPTPQTGTGPGWDTPNTAAQTPNPKPGEPGSAIELRKQRQQLLDRIQQIESHPLNPGAPADPSKGLLEDVPASLSKDQIAELDTLYREVTNLTDKISAVETPKEKAPAVLRSTGGPDDRYNIMDNGDGTITPIPNANWNGNIKPQTLTVGGRTLGITPPTPEELAADPAAKPHVTVLYDNPDEQDYLRAQTNKLNSDSEYQAKKQDLDEFVQRSNIEMEQAKMRGEDVASLQKERSLELQQKYQDAQIALDQARLAQQHVTDYNNNRHNLADERLRQQQLDDTRAQQAAQDAVLQRGQDVNAGMDVYKTQAQQADTRLTAGTNYTNSVLSMLSKMNADAPPGSDVAGRALPAFLSLGQAFFSRLGGLTTPTAPTLPPTITPTYTAPPPQQTAQPAAPPQVVSPSPAGVPPSAAAIAPFAQSGLPEGRSVAAPAVQLTPDGTPLAGVADVARAFGRAA